MFEHPQATVPGYPGPAVFDYSTQKPALPPINAGWMVAAIVFFWPLAFSAATHSSKVYPLWAQGDYAGAQYASDRAKKLGQIALLVSFVATMLILGLYTTMIAVAFSSLDDTSNYSSY